MNSPPTRYTLASSSTPTYVLQVNKHPFGNQTKSFSLSSQSDSSSNYVSDSPKSSRSTGLNHSSSSRLATSIYSVAVEPNNRASYDNILNYCSNESHSLYMKFDFRHGKIHCENAFEQRCANYDNLSYLIKEKISSSSKR